MTNKTLEKKIDYLRKEVTDLKSLIIRLSENGDPEGEYNPVFVKRILRITKNRRGSVKYTNRKDFLKLIGA